jgi:hypothetical protein
MFMVFIATCFLIVVFASQWDVTCKASKRLLLGIHYQILASQLIY